MNTLWKLNSPVGISTELLQKILFLSVLLFQYKMGSVINENV